MKIKNINYIKKQIVDLFLELGAGMVFLTIT